MKNVITLVMLIISLHAINAQYGKKVRGNGNVVTLERQTDDYDAITVGGFFDVTLIAGEEGKIILKGEDNILSYIETEVKGGTLTIRPKNNTNLIPSRGESVTITIPVDQIDALRLSGSGKLISKKTLQSDQFKVHTSGSRNVELTIMSKSVIAISSGSSNINLSGTAKNIDVTSSGSSNLNAFGLKVDTIALVASGSSNINITVNKTMDSRVSGSGNVTYRGEPSIIKNKLSGSGSVSKD